MTNVARASATGAITFAAAQLLDMRLTGRPSSDTLVRAIEKLIGHPVEGPLLRNGRRGHTDARRGGRCEGL
jgi:hypothetical protein